MHKETNKRIIILPVAFLEGLLESESFTNIVFQVILHHLTTIKSVTLINLRSESYKRLVEDPENLRKSKELKQIGTNNNSKYAISPSISLNNNNELCLNLKIYNLNIPDLIENWENVSTGIKRLSKDNYETDIKLFNSFRITTTSKIIQRLDIQIDTIIKEFLETDTIKDIIAFEGLIKATDLTKLPDERLKNIQLAIDLQPGNGLLYFEKGKILKSKKMYQEAIESLLQANAFASSNYIKALSHNELGTYYSLIANKEEAVKNWTMAIESYNDFVTPYINLALFYEEMGEFQTAEKYFLEVQKVDPLDSRTYINLARIYSKSGHWIKAIDEYNKQIENNPYDAWSYSNIGNCYLQIKKKNDAKNFFTKTLELDPDGEAGNYARQVLEALEEASKKDWWKFWKK